MKIPSPGSSLEAWEDVDDSSEEEERKQPLTGTKSKMTTAAKKGKAKDYGIKTSGKNPPNRPYQSLKMPPPTSNVDTEGVTE